MLLEFDHLVNAGDYEEAAGVLAAIDEEYLVLGGQAARSLEMHRALDGRPLSTTANMRHTFGQALARAWLGALDDSVRGLTLALDLARQLSDGVAVAECQGYLGEVSRRQGRLDDALAWTSQAVTAHQALGDTRREARWLNELSLLRVYRGEIEAATADAGRALTLVRGKDINQEALAHDALSLVHLAARRPQSAVDAADAAIALYRRSTWEHATNYVLNVKGLALVALGQVDAGVTALETALRQSSADHDSRPEGLARFNLARVWRRAGDLTRALGYAEAAAAALSRAAGELGAAQQFVEVIRAEQRGDRPAQARALLACARASRAAPDLHHPHDLAIEASRIAKQEGLAGVAAEIDSLLPALALHPDG
jgi:tetratricopeptide (TPR) repeat protein